MMPEVPHVVSADESLQVAHLAVKQLSHIATLPEVTLGIIELVEDPNSSAQDLNALIGRDPALSARVLKVVNSAFYGLPRQIGSINRAISLLGLNAVKNIAIAASLAKLFRGGALCDRFDAKELWAHSIAVATASKLLAKEARKSSGDEAFLAGLMHDIGVMVALQTDRAKLVKVFGDMQFDADGNPLIDFRMVERAVFGADHGHFGEALCEQWKFPRSLALACGHHHDPMRAPAESRHIPWIVYIADRLATENEGFRIDLLDRTIAKEALDALGLTEAQLDSVREQLTAALDEATATLSL
ncbi:MAG: HDOD domain-containing protein [Planctomycetota bacterium]|nr:MAG: HDOD domain-containing protein [Planctomycetota bacterium]